MVTLDKIRAEKLQKRKRQFPKFYEETCMDRPSKQPEKLKKHFGR